MASQKDTINTDSLAISPNEAAGLFAHHVRMAVLFFEAIPETAEPSAHGELTRVFFDFPEVQAASKEFFEKLSSIYASL